MSKVLSKSRTKIVYSDGIAIRKYSPQDEQVVRTLCCDTAYFGEPCEAFFTDRELLADLIMKYYTDYEPEHLWIAEYIGEIVGYISACFDEAKCKSIMLFKIIPPSIIPALIRGKIWDRKTYKMIVYIVKSILLKETKLVNLNYKEFPVHFHQNIKKGFRGRGIGNKLLIALLEEVEREKLSGVRFRALRHEPWFPFFEKYGFKKFDCKRVRSWEAWFKKVPLYFMEYGKSFYDSQSTKQEVKAK
ncbi:MAG: GNAT family N-acetyltransferase [Candidatus Omnitrophica bacterium]|nr:GNAT family N-acetyltransferase [Candidatus Omnitrophota bacterium]